ncbi:MAG: O-antigen ligase family protein [Hyphomicrobium sp.]|uniref:O-antigen ligase family protein n=1 Tax=Hyphomicrobium sp. TaxID=82 RepID=UPI003D1111A5
MGYLLTQAALALGSILLVLLPLAAPTVLALAGAYCCIRLPPARDELQRLLSWTALVVAYPALSALWALDPRRALIAAAGTAIIVLVSVLTYGRSGRLRDAFLPAFAYGFPVVVFVSLADVLLGIPLRTALAELGVEWVGQPRMIGKTGKVELAAVNWSIVVTALLLFPYLAATHAASRASLSRQTLRYLVVLALVATIFASPHQSSMVAVCAGAVTYAVARFHKKIAFVLVSAAWLVSISATPLLMGAALHHMPASLASSLPNSLQHRFVIWKVALRDIGRSPWVGTGAASTRAFFRANQMNKKSTKFVSVAPHSHNWFLELWRELGAVGAALGSIFALLVVQRVYVRLDHIPPEQIAFAGLVLSMSTSTFSPWAAWYVSAIGIAFAMFGMSRRDAAEPPDVRVAWRRSPTNQ